MKFLELLDCAEIPVEWRGVGPAAHARNCRILIGGGGIGNCACRRRSRSHIAEGVDEVRQYIGDAILLQIRNVVTSVTDTPLFKVASENLALLAALRQRLGGARNQAYQNRS